MECALSTRRSTPRPRHANATPTPHPRHADHYRCTHQPPSLAPPPLSSETHPIEIWVPLAKTATGWLSSLTNESNIVGHKVNESKRQAIGKIECMLDEVGKKWEVSWGGIPAVRVALHSTPSPHTSGASLAMLTCRGRSGSCSVGLSRLSGLK